jgi:hypothetical protein
MALQARRTAVTVGLTIEVPRNDRGTLTESATATVASTDAIEEVRDLELTGVVPDLNGTTVEAVADLLIAVETTGDRPPTDRDAVAVSVRRALDDRFGVCVDRVSIAA